MADEPEWTEVWKSFSDERLEVTLYAYAWLWLNTPNSHDSRIDALTQECQRRGRGDIPGRVQARCHQANEGNPARPASDPQGALRNRLTP